ncbi:MAG: WD40 repeat domain-containing protein [Dehalococcoidia bacterium]
MRRVTLPAICLIVLAAVTTACSSGSDASATPTFEPPPVTMTPSITPMPTPIPTGTVSQSTTIAADNVADLSKASSARLDEPYSRLRWRADGQAVFITTQQSVLVLQATKDEITQVYSVAAPARVLDVAADGKAAVMNDLQTVTIVDTGPDSVLQTLKIDGTVRSATFSPDSKVLAVSLEDRIAAQLWDVDKGTMAQEVTGFETAAPVYSVQFDSNGKNLIWLARAKAQVQDLITGELGPAVSEADFFSAVALSPAEKVLATTGGGVLTLWDLANGDNLDVYDLPAAASNLAYTPDGKLLFVATGTGVIALQLPLLEPVTTMPGNFRAVAVSPDGDGLATISEDGVVALYRP